MKFFFFFFILLCNACFSSEKITIDYGVEQKKFVIDGPRSRIIYEYWEKYLQVAGDSDCKKHFRENLKEWKNSPKTYDALQTTFAMFCKVHGIDDKS